MARPSKYHEKIHCNLVRILASRGYTDEEMSELMGVSVATLNNWKKSHPEFLEALKAGKNEPDEKVERALFNSAIGGYYDAQKPMVVGEGKGFSRVEIAEYREFIPANVTAQIFWLKNRRPNRWRERQEITGPDGGPIPFTVEFVKQKKQEDDERSE